MTHLEIINLLKKKELTSFELIKLFGIPAKDALEIVCECLNTSSRFYKYIDSENFKLMHGLTHNQIQIIKAALNMD